MRIKKCIHFLGTVLVTTFCYWFTAGVYMLMDYTQKPGFLMKYKIQEGKNAPPDTKKTIKVCVIHNS